MKAWTTVRSRYLVERPWMRLREDEVRLPGRSDLEEYHVVELPDWSCVVCLTEQRQLVMVEQYRHAVEAVSLELPAGAVDPGERPLAAARRELLEETGYVAGEWVALASCAPNPARASNRAFFYAALDATCAQPQTLDDREEIAVHLVDAADALRMADEGEIIHGTHLTALFWAHFRGFL